MNEQVLVLNRHYQPVNLTNVRRAFTLLYLDQARVVDENFRMFDFESWADVEPGDDSIRTISRAFRVPRVILLQTYDRMPIGHVRFSRHNIYVRDSYTCQYCAQCLPPSQLNLDHVMPRSRAGSTSWENVVCCCIPCNLKKGRRTPDEAGMPLARKPVRPRWSAIMRYPNIRRDEWTPYLAVLERSTASERSPAPRDTTAKPARRMERVS